MASPTARSSPLRTGRNSPRSVANSTPALQELCTNVNNARSRVAPHKHAKCLQRATGASFGRCRPTLLVARRGSKCTSVFLLGLESVSRKKSLHLPSRVGPQLRTIALMRLIPSALTWDLFHPLFYIWTRITPCIPCVVLIALAICFTSQPCLYSSLMLIYWILLKPCYVPPSHLLKALLQTAWLVVAVLSFTTSWCNQHPGCGVQPRLHRTKGLTIVRSPSCMTVNHLRYILSNDGHCGGIRLVKRSRTRLRTG
jgi:hypothetical protein